MTRVLKLTYDNIPMFTGGKLFMLTSIYRTQNNTDQTPLIFLCFISKENKNERVQRERERYAGKHGEGTRKASLRLARQNMTV